MISRFIKSRGNAIVGMPLYSRKALIFKDRWRTVLPERSSTAYKICDEIPLPRSVANIWKMSRGKKKSLF